MSSPGWHNAVRGTSYRHPARLDGQWNVSWTFCKRFGHLAEQWNAQVGFPSHAKNIRLEANSRTVCGGPTLSKLDARFHCLRHAWQLDRSYNSIAPSRGSEISLSVGKIFFAGFSNNYPSLGIFLSSFNEKHEFRFLKHGILQFISHRVFSI